MVNESDQPRIPDDASEIFESLHERDRWQKRAVDIAREKAETAKTEADKEYFLRLAGIMSDIRFETHEFFPEVFDD